jgi:L-fuculose-phosphate aldolase
MSKKTEHQLRREVADASLTLWERGWVANHDGNVSALASPGRVVATPTSLSKRLCTVDELIVVDEERRVVRGRNRPFSEVGLHFLVYRLRPDVGAVVHAHPPHATALAVTGRTLPCFLPESVVSLGREVPLVPFAPPGAASEKALGPYVELYDVVLLEQHGVIAVGDDVEQALMRLELAEHLARIAHLADAHGGVRALPEDLVRDLLHKRTSAGLGPEGRPKR